MKLLVVGAAGKTGRAVVEQALAAGHEVAALVHTAPVDPIRGAQVIIGDARDVTAVAAAVAGCDAIIDTVGGKTPYRRTALEADVAEALITAMHRHGVRRLIVISSLGVGDSIANTPPLVKILLATFLRGSRQDKARMEAAVRASTLDWIIVRPAVLNDKPSTGTTLAFSASDPQKAHFITRVDLAAFLITQMTGNHSIHKVITVANN